MLKEHLTKSLLAIFLLTKIALSQDDEKIPLCPVVYQSPSLISHDPLFTLPEPILFIIIRHSKKDLSFFSGISKAYHQKFSPYYLKGEPLRSYSSCTDVLKQLEQLDLCAQQEKHVDFLFEILPWQNFERMRIFSQHFEELRQSPLMQMTNADKNISKLALIYPTLQMQDTSPSYWHSLRKGCSVLWRDPFLRTGAIALSLGISGWGIYSLVQASATYQIDSQKHNETYWQTYHSILNETIHNLTIWDNQNKPWPDNTPNECMNSYDNPFTFIMCETKDRESFPEVFLEQNLTGHESILFPPRPDFITTLDQLNCLTGAPQGSIPYNWTSYLQKTYETLKNPNWFQGWKIIRLADPSLFMTLRSLPSEGQFFEKYKCTWRNGTITSPAPYERVALFDKGMEAIVYIDPVCMTQQILGPQGTIPPPMQLIAWPIVGILYYALLIMSVWYGLTI